MCYKPQNTFPLMCDKLCENMTANIVVKHKDTEADVQYQVFKCLRHPHKLQNNSCWNYFQNEWSFLFFFIESMKKFSPHKNWIKLIYSLLLHHTILMG